MESGLAVALVLGRGGSGDLHCIALRLCSFGFTRPTTWVGDFALGQHCICLGCVNLLGYSLDIRLSGSYVCSNNRGLDLRSNE